VSEISPGAVVAGISLIAAPVSSVTVWILNRRKNKASTELDAVSAAHEAVEALQIALRASKELNDDLVTANVRLLKRLQELED